MAKAKAKATNKLAAAVGLSTACPAPYKASAADKARERRYQAEDALRTITRAGEIQRDRGLMRDVKKLATEQMSTLKSVVRK